ncbi:restriction endonuclease subunit S [Herbiconiux solani]|uniref:restriction endonuclease subunit S n=1 Tax=Herbiconiux solani TaxID=661329 RepID=UPI0008254EFF|nr:restriction endonuclease subunit S [Herbiconiux solani]
MKREEFGLGSRFPIVDQSLSYLAGYTDDPRFVVDAGEYVVFGDHTRAVKWVDFPFAQGADGIKVLTASEGLISKYLYYAIDNLEVPSRGYNRHWTILRDLRIPVPPLAVQHEIVGILDQFTELNGELEAELDARQRQYAHYRTQLLDGASHEANFIELGAVGRIITGRTPKASDNAAWGSALAFVTPSDIKNGMRRISKPARSLSQAGAATMTKILVPAGSLLVTCIGADMGKTVMNVSECVTNQQINAIIPAGGVDVDYLFFVLTSMRRQIRSQGERAGGTMPILNKSDFSRIRVPVPALEVQKLVVARLDHFDALANDLSVGLPAELAARRKQYEYYRGKLLTLKEAEA